MYSKRQEEQRRTVMAESKRVKTKARTLATPQTVSTTVPVATEGEIRDILKRLSAAQLQKLVGYAGVSPANSKDSLIRQFIIVLQQHHRLNNEG